MSIIGKVYSLDSKHPQALVDDLYAEYFANHPADATIDLALAVKATERVDGEGATIEVWGAKIMRVSNPEYDEGNTSVTPHRFIASEIENTEDPKYMTRYMVEWAKAVPGAEGLYWIHKGPEGAAYATPFSLAMSDRLAAIDYALGDGRHRSYFGAAVVNRYSSQPIPMPDGPMPNVTGFLDLDLAIIERMGQRAAEKYGFGEGHPFQIALAKHLEATRTVRETEDQHGSPEHTRAHEVIVETAVELARLTSQAARKELEGKLPPELLAMLDELDGMADEIEERVSGEPKIGFRSPDAPLPKGKDIFALPEFGAADNITKPKIGFTPPTDKDRLN